MHKIYKRYPQRVMFLKSKDAIMHTAPVESVRAFFNQRIRWASKAEKYDDNRILPVLLVVYFLNSMLMILPLISFFYNVRFSFLHFHFSLIGAWLLMMILKTISELFFLLPVAAFFSRQSLLWLFPLMQPFHIIYTVIAGFLGKYGTYHWKGRSVK